MVRILKFIFKLILFIFLIILKEGFFDTLKLPPAFYTPIGRSLFHFIIFWLIVNITIRFAQFIYRKRKKLGHRYSDNVIIGLQNIYYLLTGTGFIVMILGFFGIEFSKLLTSLSIIAASIAIISKELVNDVLCGIFFSFSKEVAIGDYVRIGDFKGRVVDINIYKIVLHNDDDDIIYFSNSKAYFSDIVNYTQKKIRKYVVEFAVHNQFDIPIKDLEDILNNNLNKYSEYIDFGNETLKIIGIAKDEIKYKIHFKLNQVNPKIAEDIKSKIMEDIISKIHNSK